MQFEKMTPSCLDIGEARDISFFTMPSDRSTGAVYYIVLTKFVYIAVI